MEILDKFVKKLDAVNFVVIIFFVICMTLLLSNIFTNYVNYSNYTNNSNYYQKEKDTQNTNCDCSVNVQEAIQKAMQQVVKQNSQTEHLNSQLEQKKEQLKLLNDNNNNNDNKAILMFYYVDGCKFCREFKPEWEKINDAINNSNLKNIIKTESINCEQNRDRCSLETLNGFPTIILQKVNNTKVVYNDYPRTLQSVLNFIKQNL